MWGCLRASNPLALVAVSALACLGLACSDRIVAVDPFPCADGGVTGCPSLLNDLVGYWRLDDAPGSTTAQDGSGWGNTGTLVGLDPAVVWVDGGRAGRALSTQGMGFVEVARSASIDSITTQVTVAAWIFLEGTVVDYGTAISRQIGTSFGQHYHLSVTDADQAALFLTTTTNNQLVLYSAAIVPRNVWAHLAATYDGSHARLYLNGQEVNGAPTSGPFASDNTPVVLSGNFNEVSNRSEFFPGRLDEIMLYRRALSADEIARLHAGALGR
jgi:hypothetical protein